MSHPKPCPDCGTELPEEDSQLCPACVFRQFSGPPDPPAAQLPRDLGDYEIVEEIARGGMGVVHKARQKSLNRTVAIKTIRNAHLAREEDLLRFRTEAEAAANLDHPNIVPIYEIAQRGELHFFSMKLIEGESLAESIQRERFSFNADNARTVQRRIAELFSKIARAVHHAHQRGVLHRDIKPGNILLDARGEPHLTDFGLAKFLQSEVDLTLSATILGTIGYMSPEQAAGRSRNITTSADVYGLGAVIYESLTGHPPFPGQDALEILERIKTAEPPPPRTVNPAINIELASICQKCLEKDPGRRYASAEALAEDLDRWLAGRPVTARPASVLDHAVKWIQRHRARAVALVSLTITVVLAALIARLVDARRETDFERGYLAAEARLESGNPTAALAELVRLARLYPRKREVAERLVNALRHRVHFLPVHPPPAMPPYRSSSEALDPTNGLHNPAHTRRLVRTSPVSLEVREIDSDSTVLLLPNLHTRIIRSVRWSADGRWIVTAAADGTAAVWDSLTGTMRGLVRSADPLYDADLHPVQPGILVTASRGGEAVLWDLEEGKQIGLSMSHGKPVNSARFSPAGDLVITAAADRTVRLWHAGTGDPVSDPLAFSETVDSASFDSDNALLVVCLAPGTVRVFRRTVGLTWFDTATPFESERSEEVVGRSPDGRLVAIASERTVLLRKASRPEPHARLIHHDAVNCIAFSPDGLRLATSTAGRHIRVWNSDNGLPLTGWLAAPRPVTAIRFSPDNKLLLTGDGLQCPMHHGLQGVSERLLDVVEAIARTRVVGDQGIEPITHDAAASVLEPLLAAPPVDASAELLQALVVPSVTPTLKL